MSNVSTDSRADLAGGVARVGHQPGPALHLVRADAHLNTTIYSGEDDSLEYYLAQNTSL